MQHDLDEIRKDEQSNETKRMMSQQMAQGVGYSVMEGREAAAAEREEFEEFEERLKTFRKRQTIDMDDRCAVRGGLSRPCLRPI